MVGRDFRARCRTRIRRAALLVALLAIVVGLSPTASSAATPASVAVFGPNVMVRMGDTGLPGFVSVGSTGLTKSLTVARNEFESFQIAVKGGSALATVNNVVVNGAGLTGPNSNTIAAGNVWIARADDYLTTTPSDSEIYTTSPCSSSLNCRIPDRLVPKKDPILGVTRNAFPFDVGANQVRVVWIDVFVPTTQAPGTYSGSLNVTVGSTTTAVSLAVNVLRLRLPSTSSLAGAYGKLSTTAICGASGAHGNCMQIPNSSPPNNQDGGAFKLYDRYARAALNDRVSVYLPSKSDQFQFGNAQTGYNVFARPLLKGTAPTCSLADAAPRTTNCVWLPGAQLTGMVIDDNSAAEAGAWKQRAVQDGFVSRTYFVCDEVGGGTYPAFPQASDNWQSRCVSPYATAKSGWDGASVAPNPGPLPILMTGTIHDYDYGLAHYPATASQITRVVANVTGIDPANYPGGGDDSGHAGNDLAAYSSFLSSKKHRLWMYVACSSSGCGQPFDGAAYYRGWPSYVIDQQPSEARAMGWQLFIFGSVGDYYYDMTNVLNAITRTGCSTATSPNCLYQGLYNFGGNGDGTLFYPGLPAQIGGATGTDIPLESIRLKQIRDGREDYEMLLWLSQHGGNATAIAIAKNLFTRMYDSNKTQSQIDSARTQLINAIKAITDPTKPSVSVGDVAVYEGTSGKTQTARVTVTLSAAQASPVTVQLSTQNDTATAGSDYTAITGQQVTINAGSRSAVVPITITGDTAVEGDEQFTVQLSNPSSSIRLLDRQASVTIKDDEGLPANSASIGDVRVVESSGAVSAVATLTRHGTGAAAASVKVSTVAGSAGTGDFTPLNGQTVSFAAGQVTATVSITIAGDALREGTEHFGLALGNPVGTTVADGTGDVAITDDD
jgi:hypothetical protein